MRAIVVTPTYNESENIEEFISQLRKAAPDVHVLIVDDNSPDGTGEIADRLSREFPEQITVLHRERKEGLGRAYIAGFRYVMDKGYDVIIQMDADLSHDPVYVPKMLERIRNCDVVLGSRYTKGINVVNWDLKRLILSKTANRYVQIVTGIKATDATGGFKCWRREALEAISLADVLSNGYVFQIEMTCKAIWKGLRVEEEPIIFYERNLGASKMEFRIISEALWRVWSLRLRKSRFSR